MILCLPFINFTLKELKINDKDVQMHTYDFKQFSKNCPTANLSIFTLPEWEQFALKVGNLLVVHILQILNTSTRSFTTRSVWFM